MKGSLEDSTTLAFTLEYSSTVLQLQQVCNAPVAIDVIAFTQHDDQNSEACCTVEAETSA